MTFHFFKQLDAMDCGPTCVRMVAKYYGKNISINQLRNHSQYSKVGVSLKGISNAAETIGIKTLAVSVAANTLIHEAPLPCILHWEQTHFVVLYKAKKNKFSVADPGKGLMSYSRKEFLQLWTGSP